MPIQVQTLVVRVQSRSSHPALGDRTLHFADRLLKKTARGLLRSAADDDPWELAHDVSLEALLGRSAGRAIPSEVKATMEGLLGSDFSGVRLHSDAASEAAAARLGAEAFTVGQDVYFGAGYFDTLTSRGMGLLGHELTHVAQGLDGAPTLEPGGTFSRVDVDGFGESALERQAELNERFIARYAAGGRSASLHHAQERTAGLDLLGAWAGPPGLGADLVGGFAAGGAIDAWTPGLGGAAGDPRLKASAGGPRLRRLGGYPGSLALKAEEAGAQAAGDAGVPAPSDSIVREAIDAFRDAAPYLGAAGDLAIGFIPVVGDVYDVVCGLAGRALLSWQELDDLDRLLCFAGVIPIPFISGAVLRRGKRAVRWALNAVGVNVATVLRRTMTLALSWLRRIWSRAKTLLRRVARPVVRETDPGSLLRSSPLTRGMLRALYGDDAWKQIGDLSHAVDDMVQRFLPGANFEFRPVHLGDAPALWTTAARTGAPRAFNPGGVASLIPGAVGGVPVERIAFSGGRVTRILATSHNPTNLLSMGTAGSKELLFRALGRSSPNAALHELGHAVQFTALGAALERGILRNTEEFWDVYMTRGSGDSLARRLTDYPFAGRMEQAAQLGVDGGTGTAVSGKVGHLLEQMVEQARERITDPERARAFAELVEEIKSTLPNELLHKKRGGFDALEDRLWNRLGQDPFLDLLVDSEQTDGEPRPTRKREHGFPLEYSVRSRLEQVLGEDLSDVRIHTGFRAEQMADALEAHAFTLGRHIFMGPGAFDTESPEGLGLLVHEATHVVQDQQGQVEGPLSPGKVASLEAEAYGHEAAFVQSARARRHGPSMVQRHEPTPGPAVPAAPAAAAAPEPQPRPIQLEPGAAEFPALRKDRRVTIDPVQEVLDLYQIPLSREEFLANCKDQLMELLRDEIELENERRETLAWNPFLPQA